MLYFFLIGFLALVALVGIGIAVWYSRGAGIAITAGAVVVAIVLSLFMSATTVGARAVGIQTAFGKYTNTLPSGFHWTAPWSSTEEFSTQVQYLDVRGVPVSYAGGGGGSVDATVRWTIDAKNAENLWKRYKTFENVRDQLVAASAKDAIRVSVSPFSPVEAKDGNNLPKISEDIQKAISQAVNDDGVEIDSISITNVALDDRAQASINKIVEATANIERARAEQERARIDNETAQLREASNTPQALTRQCLDVVNNWDVNKNGQLPATFDCGLGGDADVLVGVK